MSWALIVRSVAERDLIEARRYYESVSPGLGNALVTRVDEALSAIMRFPEGCRKRHGEFRLIVLKQFPYGIFYLFDGQSISIVAIVPLMRDLPVIRGLLDR